LYQSSVELSSRRLPSISRSNVGDDSGAASNLSSHAY